MVSCMLNKCIINLNLHHYHYHHHHHHHHQSPSQSQSMSNNLTRNKMNVRMQTKTIQSNIIIYINVKVVVTTKRINIIQQINLTKVKKMMMKMSTNLMKFSWGCSVWHATLPNLPEVNTVVSARVVYGGMIITARELTTMLPKVHSVTLLDSYSAMHCHAHMHVETCLC